MANRSGQTTALLAVQPQFAALLMSGRKKVEFRRTRFREPVSTIVIYASSPTRQVVGSILVKRIECDSPTKIWKRYGKVGGISKIEFLRYFEGAEYAYAIVVEGAKPLASPRPLTDYVPSGRAPQSFQYLPIQF